MGSTCPSFGLLHRRLHWFGLFTTRGLMRALVPSRSLPAWLCGGFASPACCSRPPPSSFLPDYNTQKYTCQHALSLFSLSKLPQNFDDAPRTGHPLSHARASSCPSLPPSTTTTTSTTTATTITTTMRRRHTQMVLHQVSQLPDQPVPPRPQPSYRHPGLGEPSGVVGSYWGGGGGRPPHALRMAIGSIRSRTLSSQQRRGMSSRGRRRNRAFLPP